MNSSSEPCGMRPMNECTRPSSGRRDSRAPEPYQGAGHGQNQ
ncbi:hypothetical protein HMPREF3193_00353 [Bifidobacterium breve]|nr:hypothetical protein HMPREF3193_00353 [Bifidobacterium breve]